ncbi:hypothetical protein J3R83DRAFT_11996 [Lanmaoa asiatica]|nr:hypothetical protein J3R83DRAFT_11996 [Lanmaoa asiatica]
MSCGAPEKAMESTRISLTLDKAPHTSPPSKKPSKPGVVSFTYPTGSVDPLRPSTKSTLIRRVTSKLNIIIPSKSSTQGLRSRPSTRTLPADMGHSTQGPRPPRAVVAVSPTLPNSFISKEHREAALRERGLLPPRKDLSEQEREADQRIGSAPSPANMTLDGLSEAERLKASWLSMNRTSKSNDSGRRPLALPYLQGTRTRPQSMLPLPPSSCSSRRRCFTSIERGADGSTSSG